MRKLQIGVIGSMADTKLENSIKQCAKEVGKEIAKSKAILVFGYEGDFESVSSIAAKSAEDAGGETIAFIWGSEKTEFHKHSPIQIVTGQQRGGGREFSLILSCDVLICLSGGSGTLMEITMAYQAGIPIIVLKGTGGWSEKLAGKFLDSRKRNKVIKTQNSKDAVSRACMLGRKNTISNNLNSYGKSA